MNEYDASKAAREMAATATKEAIERVADVLDYQEKIPRGRDYFMSDDDEAGIPFESFVTALQVWAFMKAGDQATVREAAQVFQVTDDVVRMAIKDHYWMYIEGPDDDPTKQLICHEGD